MVKYIIQHLTTSSYHYLDYHEAKLLADNDQYIKEYDEEYLPEGDATADAASATDACSAPDAGDLGESGDNADGTEDRLKHLQVYGLHIIVSPPSHVTKSTKRLDRFVGH